jgi:hypothetical protein
MSRSPRTHENELGRRAFVETILFLPCGLFLLRCGVADQSNNSGAPPGPSGNEPPAAVPTVSGSDAVYTSSLDGAHYHTFEISLGDLAAPPSGGVSGETSLNDGHTHYVSVSMKDLENVQAGQSVWVTTSLDSGHTHVFTFVKVTGTSS